MGNICNYLNSAWRELLSETKENLFFPFLILALLTLPLGYAVNGIAVGVFAFVTLVTFKRKNFRMEWVLILPVLLFLLMAASFFWTADETATKRAISKVLPLLVFPVCFMMLPKLKSDQKHKILKYYSIGIVCYTIFYILKALLRYVTTGNSQVFFYHELVTEDVNAIHVSVYVAVAFFYFFVTPLKTTADKSAMILLAFFIILLSSKNIILVFILLIFCYDVFYFRATKNIKWITILLLLILSMTVVFSSQIRERFLIEFESNQHERTINKDFKTGDVYNVSVPQAWSKERFMQNDYFAGTAFRVYQIRIFNEMLHEDPILFTGYGLNATNFKIKEKGIEHNVFLGDGILEGYQEKNFHNQYIQVFAEVGIFGLLIVIAMVVINLKNAIKTKDFIHISFAILMISLFLTESFLSRQRGIVFFIIMYCLFNSKNFLRATKNEEELVQSQL